MNRLHSLVRWNKYPDKINVIVEAANAAAIVNKHDPRNGNTSLHIAAQNGHVHVIAQLIQAGAKVNSLNGKGNTALHVSFY